ncbi:MAG: phytanoyl-CoA dioxygenase family protein [Candidatus Dormibacteria bacterium]
MRSEPYLRPCDHDALATQGFLLLRGLVPRELVAGALRALERHCQLRDITMDMPIPSSEVAERAALEACMTDGVLDVVGELFGGQPFDRTRFVTGMPRFPNSTSPRMLSPHADVVHATILPDNWALAVFIFLTAVRPGGGAFMCASGSHQQLVALARLNNQEWLWRASTDPAWVERFEEVLAEPGDVLIFPHLLVHSASPNVSGLAVRHAVQARFTPEMPVRTHGTPVADMSTIQRVNCVPHSDSSRRNRSGASWPGGRRPRWSPPRLTHGLAAHAILRRNGINHLFFVHSQNPRLVQRATSNNLWGWTAGRPLFDVDGEIRSLHAEQRDGASLTVSLAGSPGESVVWVSEDLQTWTPTVPLGPGLAGRLHSTMGFASRHARGVIAHQMASEGRPVAMWRCAEDRRGLAASTRTGVLHKFEPGVEVTDLAVLPLIDATTYVLLADIVRPGDDRPRPHWSRSTWSDEFADPLVPLECETRSAPRQIRVYERGRMFWLVTYLDRRAGRDRLCVGTIDWMEARPVLLEIRSAQAFDEGLGAVGLL